MKTSSFFTAHQLLIGATIGVGVFGLPYVFSEAGIVAGLVNLLIVLALNCALLLLFAQLIIHTKGTRRLPGYAYKYLGPIGGALGAISVVGSGWGAMLAYIVAGGSFLASLLLPILGGEVVYYQLAFFAVGALAILGGLGFISRIEAFLSTILVALILLLIAGLAPSVELQYLATPINPTIFLPFGVLLFAFCSLPVLPEVVELLGRDSKKTTRAIISANVLVAVLYAGFAIVVDGVTGYFPADLALSTIFASVSMPIAIIGSAVGVFATLTSFIILGMNVFEVAMIDYRQRYLPSWIIAVLPPLVFFFIGARSFIDVIRVTGAIFSAGMFIVVIFAYLQAKKHVALTRLLTFPNLLVFILLFLLVAGSITTLLF